MEVVHVVAEHAAEATESVLVPRVVLEAHFRLNFAVVDADWSELLVRLGRVERLSCRPKLPDHLHHLPAYRAFAQVCQTRIKCPSAKTIFNGWGLIILALSTYLMFCSVFIHLGKEVMRPYRLSDCKSHSDWYLYQF